VIVIHFSVTKSPNSTQYIPFIKKLIGNFKVNIYQSCILAKVLKFYYTTSYPNYYCLVSFIITIFFLLQVSEHGLPNIIKQSKIHLNRNMKLTLDIKHYGLNNQENKPKVSPINYVTYQFKRMRNKLILIPV